MCNTFGVYRDRNDVLVSIEVAERNIAAAKKIIRDTQWPTQADYNEV